MEDRGPAETARTGFEPGRKLVHLASGLVPVGYLWLDLTRRDALVILGILSLPFLALDLGRGYLPSLNRAFLTRFAWAMRGTEEGRLTGAFYSLVGAWLTILLFEKRAACAALLILAVGDTAAALVGRALGGRRLFGQKTVAGSLAMLTVSWLLGLPFVSSWVALGGGLAATLVELLPLPVDDNLSIPLAAGGTFTLLGLVAT